MNYHIEASCIAHSDAVVHIKQSHISFGTTADTADTLPNPAELFLGAFASCILKNVERFSGILKFTYSKAIINVNATRLENPPRMDHIIYQLIIHTTDAKLNTVLLQKNIEKFGTIFNTVKQSCSISGTINIQNHV
jgi:uncharacterized OsmC-like protein